MPIFTQVTDKLRENDQIMAMSSSEFLDVEVSDGLWSIKPSFPVDAEELPPRKRLMPFALFVRKLYDYSDQLEKLPFFPDPRDPESTCQFKANENIILAFCSDNPVWYWERKNDLWQLCMMRVSRESNMDEPLDIDDLLEEFENYEDEDGDIRNDPENLTPDPLLGVFQHFIRVLANGHRQLEEEPYFPDSANPNGKYRFRSNGQLIVAYRRISGNDYQPAWCWRWQENGTWKLYRIRISVSSAIHMMDSWIEPELKNGIWD